MCHICKKRAMEPTVFHGSFIYLLVLRDAKIIHPIKYNTLSNPNRG